MNPASRDIIHCWTCWRSQATSDAWWFGKHGFQSSRCVSWVAMVCTIIQILPRKETCKQIWQPILRRGRRNQVVMIKILLSLLVLRIGSIPGSTPINYFSSLVDCWYYTEFMLQLIWIWRSFLEGSEVDKNFHPVQSEQLNQKDISALTSEQWNPSPALLIRLQAIWRFPVWWMKTIL